jgi:hypothetical protein
MHVDELRKWMHTAPFRPFIIHLADGRKFRVHHADYIATSPTGHSAVVYESDGGFEIIELLLVTSLEVDPTPPRHNRRASG